MRCQACNEQLSDIDTSRKSTITGKYFDLCTLCFDSIREQVTFTSQEKSDDEIIPEEYE